MKRQKWIINVAGDYGYYEFIGTETEAEDERIRKSRWEQAVATKTLSEVQSSMKKGYRFSVETCTKCKELVSTNWIVRHIKSGCEKGIIK